MFLCILCCIGVTSKYSKLSKLVSIVFYCIVSCCIALYNVVCCHVLHLP